MVFSVVMYVCESWTKKKAEHQSIDDFELWCSWVLLRVPWTAKRSNKSILKEISPEYSLEGLMLKLKLQYFHHLIEELTNWERPSFDFCGSTSVLITIACVIIWSQGAWSCQLLLFFLKIVLALQGVLYFHTHCKMFCSSSRRNSICNLIQIASNL